MFRINRILQPRYFPEEYINRKQILHQKLWKIYIIAFSKTLSKVSFISSPHCHKRSNKNVFLFPAKRPPHVLRYPHNSFLLHLKQKEHFLLHFQGQCHGIYMSTKLQIRKENRNKVGRVPRNVGRYEESVNGDLWESLRELWIGQPLTLGPSPFSVCDVIQLIKFLNFLYRLFISALWLGPTTISERLSILYKNDGAIDSNDRISKKVHHI